MGALILCCLFYLIGAFPTGFIVGRLHGINISDHGSGNVGATNISRVLGKRAGIITLFGDLAKGFLPITLLELAGFTSGNLGCLSLFIIMGHCFSLPPWLHGGKGVATALGIFLALSPLLALMALLSFAITIALWRIVSLASVLTAILAPVYAMLIFSEFYQPYVPWLMAISGIVVLRHRENLSRLIQGTEARFDYKRE